MKKLVLGALLLLSMSASAQGTFVIKYTTFLTNINDVKSELKFSDTTFVFNDENTTDIVVYGLPEEIRYYRTGKITESETTGGHKYQLVDCIQAKTGTRATIQLFDTAVRVFLGNDYIEYQR